MGGQANTRCESLLTPVYPLFCRDDLIFFVYLYQRWAYPVDHSRVNEFGQESQEGEREGDVEPAESQRHEQEPKQEHGRGQKEE